MRERLRPARRPCGVVGAIGGSPCPRKFGRLSRSLSQFLQTSLRLATNNARLITPIPKKPGPALTRSKPPLKQPEGECRNDEEIH